MVHDSRSCSINQDRSWLYEVQLSCANQIPCDLIEWEMDRDDVRLSEQIIERCIDDTVDGGFVPLDDVISKDIHAKAESASGNCGTNLPHANDASRLSIETRPRTLCPASGQVSITIWDIWRSRSRMSPNVKSAISSLFDVDA